LADGSPSNAEAARPWTWRRVREAAARNRFLAVLLFLIVLFVFFSATQDRFLSEQNIKNLLTSVAILWVVAMGLTFVLISAGFDLSVGSMVALAGIFLALFYNTLGMPAVPAVLCTILVGAALGGGINGFLVGRIGLSFLVVTLGTLILFRGLVNIISETRTESVDSQFVEEIGFGEVLGLPTPIWIMLGTFLIALFVLRRTYFGRDVYAVGGNPEAARVSGVRVAWTIMAVYGISGACAALAGVMQVGRIGAASPLVGETVLFDAAAAVLLGGTSFTGGVGGVGGTAVGVLFIGVLQNGLGIAGVPAFWQQAVIGSILIVAVFLDKIQREGLSSLGFGRGRTGRRKSAAARREAERAER
jgi:ribose transport system permease protein